ncbi:MAG: lysophospholipid acyltransferase family protein [Nitrospirae bacterium]|nr:lysophospholipid acyltransferase family protein [Nitrospirota bacterium]
MLILLSAPLAILPFGFSIKAGEFLGLLLFYAWGSRRRIAIENIEKSEIGRQKAEGRRQKWEVSIAKESFKNLGRSFVEVIKIYYGLGRGLIDSVEIEGVENFHNARKKGKGIIFITGHCGNWELSAIAMSVKIGKSSGVARRIDNPCLNKIVEGIRQRYGNSIIYKQGALKSIIKKVREGGCVGILMDQAVLADEGYVIDFLGRGAWTTKMPAMIARKTGAAVLPTFIRRVDGRHRITIHPQVELSTTGDKEKAAVEDTKKFSSYIEEYIKGNPAEWLWIHRRWKRVPPASGYCPD